MTGLESKTPVILPIAETFTSIQGEGRFTGTPMTFIRLAGCTVGKPFTKEELTTFNVVQPNLEKCTDWSGNEFCCDTNYKSTAKKTIQEILDQDLDARVQRVCITGGEPLMHKHFHSLAGALQTIGKKVHVETSGTVLLSTGTNFAFPDYNAMYVAVSPKQNYLPEMLVRANEIKVLIGEWFNKQDEERFLERFGDYLNKVFLQPINDEMILNTDSLTKCLSLQAKYPQCGVSIQLHKVLGMR